MVNLKNSSMMMLYLQRVFPKFRLYPNFSTCIMHLFNTTLQINAYNSFLILPES